MPIPFAGPSLLVCASLIATSAAAADLLQPFCGRCAGGSTPSAPWEVLGLPQQAKPFTRFSVVEIDGRRALRVEADNSYGNLFHPLERADPPHHLAWDWRVDEPNPAADLHERRGDDVAMKVCVLWNMPIERVPFVERQLLRLARHRAGRPLPAATVCYVWDSHLAAGVAVTNAFTPRLRYLVLRGPGDPLHHWEHERRDIAADFLQLFGGESHEVPPLAGVAVGADADNTHAHSVGHAADLHFEP